MNENTKITLFTFLQKVKNEHLNLKKTKYQLIQSKKPFFRRVTLFAKVVIGTNQSDTKWKMLPVNSVVKWHKLSFYFNRSGRSVNTLSGDLKKQETFSKKWKNLIFWQKMSFLPKTRKSRKFVSTPPCLISGSTFDDPFLDHFFNS